MASSCASGAARAAFVAAAAPGWAPVVCSGGGSRAGVLAGAGDVTASTARLLLCWKSCTVTQAIQRLRCQVSTMGRGEMGFREGGRGRWPPIKENAGSLLAVWSLYTSLGVSPLSRAGARQVSSLSRTAPWCEMNMEEREAFVPKTPGRRRDLHQSRVFTRHHAHSIVHCVIPPFRLPPVQLIVTTSVISAADTWSQQTLLVRAAGGSSMMSPPALPTLPSEILRCIALTALAAEGSTVRDRLRLGLVCRAWDDSIRSAHSPHAWCAEPKLWS